MIEVGSFVAILYSLPKHHIGESEAVSTDGSGSQKYCTIRLYRSTVVIVTPYAARGWVFSGIDVAGSEGGDVGDGEMLRAVGGVEGRLSGGEGGEELIKSSKVL